MPRLPAPLALRSQEVADVRDGRAAAANTLVVMCSGAFAGVLQKVRPGFQQVTERAVEVIAGSSVGTTPRAIPVRLRGSEAADLVILFDDAIDTLIGERLLVQGSKVRLATSAIGVAVRRGSLKADIGSAGAVRSAMLGASSFAYSASMSGNYVASGLLSKLDLPEEVSRRGVRVVGEPVGAVVARGEAALGFQQMSELLPIEGIDVIGPLPADIQQLSILSSGSPVTTKDAVGSRALVAYLLSGDARPALIGAGLGAIVGA